MRSELRCANYIWLHHDGFVAHKIRSAVFTTLIIDTGSWLYWPHILLITDSDISSFGCITETNSESSDKSVTSITKSYQLMRFLRLWHEIYEFVVDTKKRCNAFRLSYERSIIKCLSSSSSVLCNLARNINDLQSYSVNWLFLQRSLKATTTLNVSGRIII